MPEFNEAREREIFDRMHVRMTGPKGGFTHWSIFNEIEKAAAWKAWQARASMSEGGPDFTATARAALLWVLFHHQGFNSSVGVPIRYALGMGADEELSDAQIAEARRWADIWSSPVADGVKDKNNG
jgi:hypothetical protein